MKGTMPPIDAAIRPAFRACRPGNSRGAEFRTPATKKRNQKNDNCCYENLKRNHENDSSSLKCLWNVGASNQLLPRIIHYHLNKNNQKSLCLLLLISFILN